ncbi:MAG TPA: hypothetical protein PK883_00595, partial [Anaerolineaceae bacterium]|nr:hypothetical protein [Anaerolineaceae bacterium]
MKKAFRLLAVFSLTLILLLSACGAPQVTETAAPIESTSTPTPQPAPSIPPEVPGEVVYIPFPVPIQVDGDLSDWADIPSIYVDRGPTPSADPAENGSFTFSVAADADYLYV